LNPGIGCDIKIAIAALLYRIYILVNNTYDYAFTATAVLLIALPPTHP